MAAGPYSATLLDHFMNPRNVGTIENPDGFGEIGNPAFGIMVQLFLSVKDGAISDARFRTFGCAAVIASSSVVTELVMGKTPVEARRITRQDIAGALDGVPPAKSHCPAMAERAVHAALDDYASRQRG